MSRMQTSSLATKPFLVSKRLITVWYRPCTQKLSSLKCKKRMMSARCMMSARNINYGSYVPSSSTEKVLISTWHSPSLNGTLSQLNHQALQCRSTSWHALSISSSNHRNCARVVAGRRDWEIYYFCYGWNNVIESKIWNLHSDFFGNIVQLNWVPNLFIHKNNKTTMLSHYKTWAVCCDCKLSSVYQSLFLKMLSEDK